MSRWRRARAGCSSATRWSAAGAVAHLAEPVETRALRGRKRRAKTDREDARWLRELLAEGRLPEAWIPPEHVRQWRSRARLRHTLIDERTQWMQRIQATLFHHGVSGTPGEAAHPRRPRVPRRARAARRRARADRDRAGDGRRDRRADRAAGARAAPARAPPDRLPGADGPLRDGRADLAGHALRARRRRAPVGVAQGGPDGRHRHRRAPLRPPRARRQAHPPRLPAAALGAL